MTPVMVSECVEKICYCSGTGPSGGGGQLLPISFHIQADVSRFYLF